MDRIFTWIASSPAGIEHFKECEDGDKEFDYFEHVQKGSVVILDGTVKDHKEYKGDKQTVLTRCKIKSIA